MANMLRKAVSILDVGIVLRDFWRKDVPSILIVREWGRRGGSVVRRPFSFCRGLGWLTAVPNSSSRGATPLLTSTGTRHAEDTCTQNTLIK